MSIAPEKLRTILVVDDEEEIAELLVEALHYAGYEAVAAANGEEALTYLKLRPFALLLSDIHMPKMRGEELQRKAQKLDPYLGIIMITAAIDLSIAVNCMKNGGFDYIAKPFYIKDVLARVENALERRQLLLFRARYEREQTAQQAELEAQVAEQAQCITRLYEEKISLQHRMFLNALVALNNALEAKDGYTRDHSWRVAEIASKLTNALYPQNASFGHSLYLAALFHDIGKIGVREAVLNKPGKLTPKEFAEIEKHPVLSEDILRPIFDSPEILEIVRHHHEAWNGTGYPDNLGSEEIPLGARIVAVADSYDAMTSERPYRAGMLPQQALEILREGAGEQWDAKIVVALLRLAENGELNALTNAMRTARWSDEEQNRIALMISSSLSDNAVLPNHLPKAA